MLLPSKFFINLKVGNIAMNICYSFPSPFGNQWIYQSSKEAGSLKTAAKKMIISNCSPSRTMSTRWIWWSLQSLSTLSYNYVVVAKPWQIIMWVIFRIISMNSSRACVSGSLHFSFSTPLTEVEAAGATLTLMTTQELACRRKSGKGNIHEDQCTDIK